MANIMVIGPYGGKNLGDDLILEMILGQLRSSKCKVIVSCNDPTAITDTHKVPAVSLLEYRNWTVESLSTLKTMDCVIIGGGEQLSEPRITNPIWGHLARTAHICRVAYKSNIPCMLWAVGVDSFRSNLSKWLVKNWVCQKDIVCSFRDEDSVQRIKGIGVQSEANIYRVADPAYLLEEENYSKSRQFLFSQLDEADDGRDVMIIIPANDKLISLGYIGHLIELGKRMESLGWKVIGWVTDLQPKYDLHVREWDRWDEIPGFKWIPIAYFNARQMAKIIRGTQLVVSARMHPLIVAQTQNVLCFSIIRSKKMEAMSRELGLESVGVEDLDIEYVEKMTNFLQWASQSKDLRKLKRRSSLEKMRRLAQKSQEIFNSNILERHRIR